MTDPIVYIFRPSEDTAYNLARREIFWLVKDRLIDSSQSGWSVSHGQVELYPPQHDEGVLGHLESDPEPIRECIEEFLNGDIGFLVPLAERLDDELLARRLATVEDAGVIEDVHAATVEPLRELGEFWKGLDSASTIDSGPAERRAAFNIAHPYLEGPMFDGNVESEFMLSTRGIEHNEPRGGPLYSAFFSCASPTLETLTENVTRILPRVPTGTYLAISNHCDGESQYAMDEQDISTNALSAGSVLIEISNRDINAREIAAFNEAMDQYGMSLAGEFTTAMATFLLFKCHPRHKDVETAGPTFDGNRERRKLSHTEWARETLPGYKILESGKREVTMSSFEGWDITVQRPGRKDADDFTYHINGPEVSGIEETKPHLHRIFTDVSRHLYCPASGRAFLDTLHQIWEAKMDMGDCKQFIEERDDQMTNCSASKELWYDRRVLLYSLALQFIVEDINYRFNFHPTYGGPSYRKQGRDQPMNGLYQIGANQFSEEEIIELAESTKKGGLLTRPRAFNGPAHLEDWYQDHGILTAGAYTTSD